MADFDRSAYDALMAQADAEGMFANAQSDWQPEDEVLATITDLVRDVRKDEKSGKTYNTFKPILTIVSGSKPGLEGKTFPLSRYPFKYGPVEHAELDCKKLGIFASAIAGEPMQSQQASEAVFERAKANGSVLQVQPYTFKKRDGSTGHDLRIAGVVATEAAPPATA